MARPVLVARTAPDAQESCTQLKALGYDAIALVTAELVFDPSPLDLTGIEAVALTSRNGARALARMTDQRHIPVFAVGEATANQARSLGFDALSSAGGDVTALADLIHTTHPNASILHVRGEEQAGDLVASLQTLGMQARSQIAYAARAPNTLSEQAFTALAQGAFVLVYSAKGAERLIALAQNRDLTGALLQAPIIAISEAAATPLTKAGAQDITLARSPDQDALFAALKHRVQSPL